MDDRADRARALGAEADALLNAGRLAQAEPLYREAIAFEPTPARLQNLATIRQLLGAYPEAERLFRDALALDPAYSAW